MFAKLTIALLSTVYAVQGRDRPERCMALSLEGGGAKGAYEAGVVWGMMHYGKPENFEW